MLRLRIVQTRTEEPATGRHTAELVDERGQVIYAGHVVADVEVNLGSDQVVSGLRFVSEPIPDTP